jgi:hypothetical protein
MKAAPAHLPVIKAMRPLVHLCLRLLAVLRRPPVQRRAGLREQQLQKLLLPGDALGVQQLQSLEVQLQGEGGGEGWLRVV